MKKLLIITNTQFGYGMGYHHQIEYLNKDFEIDFFCFNDNLSEIINENANIIYFPYLKGKNKYIRIIQFTIEAIKISFQKKYDIIIVSQGYLDLLIGLIAKAKLKINYILTGDLNKNNFIRKFMNLKIKLFTLPFDNIFVLSDGLKKHLKLSKRKTIVIPLGSNVIEGKKKIYNKMHLIYLGTFFQRNIDITLNALSKFYKNYGNRISLKYYIVGFGVDEINKFNQIIQENNMQDVVEIICQKSHYELKEIFSDCTIGIGFVPQTEFYEYQPSTKIIEYALSGLITIATDTYENRRMINDNNGVICQDNEESFYNALVSVYNNLQTYNDNLIKKSLEYLTWENICNKYIIPSIITKET